MAADSSFKIVIVDESPIRAAIPNEGLRDAGFISVEHISEMNNLLARIYAMDPDVILIDLENPSRDILEQMFQVSRSAICYAIASGAARSPSDIGAQLKAGTNCGSCIPELKRLIAQTPIDEAGSGSLVRPAASAAN